MRRRPCSATTTLYYIAMAGFTVGASLLASCSEQAFEPGPDQLEQKEAVISYDFKLQSWARTTSGESIWSFSQGGSAVLEPRWDRGDNPLCSFSSTVDISIISGSDECPINTSLWIPAEVYTGPGFYEFQWSYGADSEFSSYDLHPPITGSLPRAGVTSEGYQEPACAGPYFPSTIVRCEDSDCPDCPPKPALGAVSATWQCTILVDTHSSTLVEGNFDCTIEQTWCGTCSAKLSEKCINEKCYTQTNLIEIRNGFFRYTAGAGCISVPTPSMPASTTPPLDTEYPT